MSLIVVTFMLLWSLHLAAPETPAGRTIRRLLVDIPAARMARISRGQMVLVALTIAAIAGTCWIERDAVQLLAMSAPDLAAFAATFEITTWLDVAIALAITATGVRLHGLIASARALLHRPRSRSRRTLPRKPAAGNDDDVDEQGRIAA